MNSVFLHLRQLLLFANKSKTDLLFRTINIINLGRRTLTSARREGDVEVEHRVPLTSIVPFSLVVYSSDLRDISLRSDDLHVAMVD